MNRVGIQRRLASRQDLHHVDHLAGDLRFRREVAQGFDLVIQEIDAQRCVGAHREQVDQRAAHRELAVLGYLRHARVAGGDQRFDERLPRQRLAATERERAGRDVVGGRQTLLQGRRGRHDDATLQRRQRLQHLEALRDDVLVR